MGKLSHQHKPTTTATSQRKPLTKTTHETVEDTTHAEKHMCNEKTQKLIPTKTPNLPKLIPEAVKWMKFQRT